MIAIVDYGVGNLFSLLSSLRALDLEAVFKGTGRALKMAVALDEKHRDEIPSTKGLL